jgi:hypothetical protein
VDEKNTLTSTIMEESAFQFGEQFRHVDYLIYFGKWAASGLTKFDKVMLDHPKPNICNALNE